MARYLIRLINYSLRLKLQKAAYCEAAEKWDSDSDSDKSEDEEDLKM